MCLVWDILNLRDQRQKKKKKKPNDKFNYM